MVKFAKSPGRLPHYVFFGLFRRKEICLLLIIQSFRSKGWKTFLFVIYGLGLGVCRCSPTFLFSFIDWLGSKWGQIMFFVLFFPHLVEPFGGWYILPVYFGTLFWCFLLVYSFFYLWKTQKQEQWDLIKKKKEEQWEIRWKNIVLFG